MMRYFKILAIGFVLVIGLSISAVAASTLTRPVSTAPAYSMPNADATPKPGKTKVPETETKDDDDADNPSIAQAIAKHFKVTEAEVLAWHDSGKGFGEIVKAYALAQASGKSANDIFAMRANGQGWGEIAQSLDVGKWDTSLGQILRDAPPNKKPTPGGGAPDNRGRGKNKDKGK